jgi:hypothetical protein
MRLISIIFLFYAIIGQAAAHVGEWQPVMEKWQQDEEGNYHFKSAYDPFQEKGEYLLDALSAKQELAINAALERLFTIQPNGDGTFKVFLNKAFFKEYFCSESFLGRRFRQMSAAQLDQLWESRKAGDLVLLQECIFPLVKVYHVARPPQIQKFFHCTSQEVGEAITKEGFKITTEASSNLFKGLLGWGAGIYFAGCPQVSYGDCTIAIELEEQARILYLPYPPLGDEQREIIFFLEQYLGISSLGDSDPVVSNEVVRRIFKMLNLDGVFGQDFTSGNTNTLSLTHPGCIKSIEI